MRLAVYGTLKSGYNNHIFLKNATLLGEEVIEGFKLFYSYGDSGFPVAKFDKDSSLLAEIYEINEEILRGTDRLEANGFMYNREIIQTSYGDTYLYVGQREYWRDFKKMNECPKRDSVFIWG